MDNQNKGIDQEFEFEAFVYTYYIWIVLIAFGLFYLMVFIPFNWSIGYFWGWELVNDFKYPLMKKLSIFTFIVTPFTLIYIKSIIYIFKKKITIKIDKKNQINIQKNGLGKSIFTLDIRNPFTIELIEREVNETNKTYIIKFKNEKNKIINLSCPKKIIKKNKKFVVFQEFLKNRFNSENIIQMTDFNIKSKIGIKRTLIKNKKHE